MISCLDQFRVWVDNPHSLPFPRNKWFYSKEMDVYLRVFQFQHAKQLDIASVIVHYPQRGIFGRFMNDIEQYAVTMNFDRIKVESIQEPIVEGMCERRGYIREPSPYAFCPSYIKIIG